MKKIDNLRDICIVSHNTSDDNYVGIKYSDDDVKIFFPLGYDIPEDNSRCRKSIMNLVRTISIGNRVLSSDSENSILDGNEYEIPFESFIWIINDYLNNGLYNDKERIYKRGQNGKINWKKTLNTKFFVSGNSVVYLNPYVEKNTLEDNVITDIHAFCVGVSINYIGWMFGEIPLPSTKVNSEKSAYYIKILNREMVNSFDDRKKLLLINLKKIMKMVGGKSKSRLINYGTTKYEYIWEYMIDKIYGNENVELFFPNSKYHLINIDKPVESSNLRPDTLLSVGNDMYILDSKYYKYGVTGNPLNLPSTDSVQKQITYGEHIKNNFKKYKKIYNAFIIPFNKHNNPFNLFNNIEYVGFSESSWKKNSNRDFYERISVILIDTKYLIDKFTSYNDNEVEKMIASIQKIVDTYTKDDDSKTG